VSLGIRAKMKEDAKHAKIQTVVAISSQTPLRPDCAGVFPVDDSKQHMFALDCSRLLRGQLFFLYVPDVFFIESKHLRRMVSNGPHKVSPHWVEAFASHIRTF
jgi:hypothetical protein